MLLEKRKRGRKAKFSLSSVAEAPIKAVGYAKKFPHQYANYWNKRNPDNQVEVVYTKKGVLYFRQKQLAPT